MQRVFVGTSGWTYDHWRGPFYPDGLVKAGWLKHYARTFSTVEVNATFYRSMRPSTYETWRAATPEGFIWSVKANRFVTHVRRLRDPGEPLALFLDSLEPLGDKLGPILFQLPTSLAFDADLVRSFRRLLPPGRRYAIEARHGSWTSDAALSCLKDGGIAWCISDTAGRYPYLETVTSDFIYVRLHGSKRLYASRYSEEELSAWAGRIRSWEMDVYIYFNNDFMGYAPMNAIRLGEMLGLIHGPGLPPGSP